MGAFVFNDHPIDDLIRKNLNVARVFARAARNQGTRSTGTAAMTNAQQAFESALQLVRSLDDADQERWQPELLAVQAELLPVKVTD